MAVSTLNLARMKAVCAAYHQKQVADLTQNSVDLFLVAANNVRRNAEKLQSFEMARCTAVLDIDGASGGRLDDAVIDGNEATSVAVTGTLSPDVTGTYIEQGAFGAFPVYVLAGATTYFLYYHPLLATYIIHSVLSTGAVTNAFVPAVDQLFVNGAYLGTGTSTGTATAVLTQGMFSGVREVIALSGLRNGSSFVPLDFTRADIQIERERYELELSNNFWPSNRYPSDADVLNTLGAGTLVLRNNTIYNFPRSITPSTVPLTVYIEGYGWLREYNAGDVVDMSLEPQDFIVANGFNYLQWSIIIELNHIYHTYVPRQEGNTGGPKDLRDEAWRDLLLWDSYLVDAHITRSR